MARLQRLAIAPEQIDQARIALNPEQAHYLRRVLRLRAGDRFIAINGQGQWWLAELGNNNPQAQLLESLPAPTELPLPVTLMAALVKGRGFDEIVRSSTELGITGLVPLLSKRTLVNPSHQKLNRWRRVATEAAEQSQRPVIPQIRAPMSLVQALQSEPLSLPGSPTQYAHYICITDLGAPLLWDCLEPWPSVGITVITGPEGGWSPSEQELAVSAGIQPVSLGRRVLRAMTAPLCALSIIGARLESVVGQEEMIS